VIEVIAATEHQVLEQMGKAGLARLLVLRAHVVPGIHSHDGRLVILVHQNGQPIIENKLRVANVGDGNVYPGNCGCRFVNRGGLRLRDGSDGVVDEQGHDCEQAYRTESQ